ncbi:FKBP-type peptidyl-prolyl cis-trans isomerase [Phaeodactylibacter luteus]|uniref:Peptidyl-prolyl cis-trans isomerase n=1 Tax=Phaeodactylibacter luteus TaxID=1564516 RepID=A0A5C6RI99_9BACT|nr:FKBP-type peptidyl-prolyl cis-trans isomerase [Phaeodactylibacter luteus]TXB61917.1 hypothetical protein FRY97_16845 [Phaeodactylibacter luteus]
MLKPPLFLIALLCLLLCWSCGPAAPEQQTQAQNAPPPTPVDEDAAILQLSAYLIASPATLAEQQQNDIVNYAMDELIPLERTPTGLFYRILSEGSGPALEWGDYVEAHYKGYTLDGQIFDSSYRKGRPLRFYIGNMISGWNEGLQLIRPGGRMALFIPSNLGYGEKGVPDGKGGFVIAPDAPLVFEVEVLRKLNE